MGAYPTPQPALRTARQILANAFPDMFVGTKVPYSLEPPIRPPIFIVVTQAGGTRPQLVTVAAHLIIQCWAGGVPDVENLSHQAMTALQNAEGTTINTDIYSVFVRGFDNIEGPVDFPDPDVTDLERWQFTGDLLVSTG